MKIFTGAEVQLLKIIAINSRDSDLRDFLNRSILTRLGDQARIAGLILLKREAEVKEISKFFSYDTLSEIREYCQWIEAEASNTIVQLEERIANTRRSSVMSA